MSRARKREYFDVYLSDTQFRTLSKGKTVCRPLNGSEKMVSIHRADSAAKRKIRKLQSEIRRLKRVSSVG